LLAAGAPAASRQAAVDAQQALATRALPTANAAALIHALEGAADPFGGNRAAVIGVGPGAASELDLLIDATGRRAIVGAFAIDPDHDEAAKNRVQTSPGDVWDQVDAALQWASRQIDAATADVIAILLRPPVTGSWESEESFDVPRLVRLLLRDHAHPVWLTMAEPTDPTAWPDNVVVMLPLPTRVFRRALRRQGISALPKPRRSARRTVHLSATAACQTVLGLTDRLAPPPVRESLGPAAQRYGAEITLGLRTTASPDTAHVGLDASTSQDLQTFLDAANVKFAARQPDGAHLLLPLTIVPNRLIAWRANRPGALTAPPPIPTLESVPATRWLTEACESRDESVAAAVLADHGRAWIESQSLNQALPLLRRAAQTFPRSTRAHLWANYLLALDSALRLNAPDANWFDEEMCQLAKGTELALLYQVERMEFRRLRGEMDAACADLNALAHQLTAPITATAGSALYAQATARYVAANTLRRGGRYDRARDLIDAAVAAYNPDIPAHRIELTHGTYAIAVCDSLRGTATVRTTNADAGQAVFARSLVTLANSHASWFVEDYDRAVDFAQQARAGFTTIGYQRYADRSRDLARLIADWARRSGRPVTPTGQPDPRVDALLATPPAGTADQLATERPSRALSLIYFATAFSKDPDAPRAIELPSHIAVNDHGAFTLRSPAPATSFRDAEQQLRAVLGVATDTRLPLAAD
jgi:tetratricopeptide (TPR) repeat protein